MHHVYMLNASHLAALLDRSHLQLAAGPSPRKLTRNCRVRLWTGELGTFTGWTRDGWCRVHVDGERTITGGIRVDEWQRWQLEAIDAPAAVTADTVTDAQIRALLAATFEVEIYDACECALLAPLVDASLADHMTQAASIAWGRQICADAINRSVRS